MNYNLLHYPITIQLKKKMNLQIKKTPKNNNFSHIFKNTVYLTNYSIIFLS